MQTDNDLKTKIIAMTTKAKTILSSLYETRGSPCGRVFEWFTPPNKSLTNNTLQHTSTIITISQQSSRAVATDVIFRKTRRKIRRFSQKNFGIY